MRRDVFQAIADPQRRKIINLLVRQSFSINELAKNFKISRPAVSKHIKILRECGVIKIRQEGRERFCIANLEKLKTISDWVEKYSIFWLNKLV
jgi:DNA-binding transcriptional ArsR family regulator